MELGRNIKSKLGSILPLGDLHRKVIPWCKSLYHTPMHRWEQELRRIKCDAAERFKKSRRHLFYYIPGAFLLSMGFSLLLAPSLFLALMSGLLIYAGVASIYLGRKLIITVAKYRDVVKQVEARIYIKGHGDRTEKWAEQPIQDAPDKKTVFH